MNTIQLLVQSLGVAYAGAINLPATVAILGLSQRAGWVPRLPGLLDALDNPWVIGVSLLLVAVEFLATLLPGIASLWDTAQTLIRPPAATVLALAPLVDLPPPMILGATLLAGTLALSAHGAKLGIRYAVDASPEPVTNGLLSVAELGVVVSLVVGIWHHPYLALTLALLLLTALVLMVRAIARALVGVLRGRTRGAPA